jgi:hypothetical protein
MRTINTLQELRQERQRLYLRKAFLETEIKKDFEDIKEHLKPLEMLTKGAEKMLGSKDNSVLGNSAGFLADVLVKNVILRNAGFITRMIVPFLAKKATVNVVEDHKSQIMGWFEELIAKIKARREEKKERRQEAG